MSQSQVPVLVLTEIIKLDTFSMQVEVFCILLLSLQLIAGQQDYRLQQQQYEYPTEQQYQQRVDNSQYEFYPQQQFNEPAIQYPQQQQQYAPKQPNVDRYYETDNRYIQVGFKDL